MYIGQARAPNLLKIPDMTACQFGKQVKLLLHG